MPFAASASRVMEPRAARVTAVVHGESRADLERLLLPLRPGTRVEQLLDLARARSEALTSSGGDCELRLNAEDGPWVYPRDDVGDVLRDGDEVHIVQRRRRRTPKPAAVTGAPESKLREPELSPLPWSKCDAAGFNRPRELDGASGGASVHSYGSFRSGSSGFCAVVKCVAVLRGHADDVCSVAPVPCGRLLSGSYDGTVIIWDPVLEQRAAVLEAGAPVSAVAAVPNFSRAIATAGGSLILFETAGGERLRVLGGDPDAPDFSSGTVSDGRVVTGNEKGALQLWDLETGRCVRTFEDHCGEIYQVSTMATGNRVASASGDGTVRIWDLSAGASAVRQFDIGAAVYGVVELPSGRLASGSLDGSVQVWEPSQERAVRTRHNTAAVYALAAVGRDVVAFGSFDRTIKLWDASDDGSLTTLVGHDFAVRSVAALDASGALASGSFDATVRIWAAR